MFKKVLKWFGYILYLLLFVVLVDFAFYKIYMARITLIPDWLSDLRIDEFTKKTCGVVARGSTRKNYLTYNDRVKRPGVMRVACLGDSFTYGAEIKDGYDYPSFLQKHLDDLGGKNKYEVFNYGIPWFSISESFLMWKQYAVHDNPDLVVFAGPWHYYRNRELTFNHTFESLRGGWYPYCHSRFILSKDRSALRQIDVKGDTVEKITRNYSSFLPQWDYLRYDTAAPMFIRAPLAIFFPERTIHNPFYYTNLGDSEVDRIVSLIFKQITMDTSQLLFVPFKNYGYIDLADNNKIITKVYDGIERFPYEMLHGHQSSLGNDLLARFIAGNILQSKADIEYLEFSDIENKIDVVDGFMGFSQSRASFILDDVVLADLCDMNQGSNFDGYYPAAVGLLDKGKSLLALKRADTSMLDALFISWPFSSVDNDGVTLEVIGKHNNKVKYKGRLPCVKRYGFLNIWECKTDNLFSLWDRVIFDAQGGKYMHKDGDRLFLSTFGQRIFLGKIRQVRYRGESRYVVDFNEGVFFKVCMRSDVWLDVAKMSEEGTLEVIVESKVGGMAKYPFAIWHKKRMETNEFADVAGRN